ncbi:MAG: hypothetical protein HONBIEJF_01346 [Fimbriimonadaceae bacterium]|nr:hypothetical protein [Fimbriimonadaceae bacterium]
MLNRVQSLDTSFYKETPRVEPKSELDISTFIRLLTVQLANQNPLEPMSDRDFFAQMAQLGQVEGMDKLRDSMEMTQASALMGKTVTALRSMTESGSGGENGIVSGKVVKLTVRQGQQYLGLQEPDGGIVDVPMSAVREVSG